MNNMNKINLLQAVVVLAFSTALLPLCVQSALAQEQAPPDTTEGVIVHEVHEGETLYSISREYEASLQEIRNWNEIDDFTIYIGQQLIVGVVDRDEIPEDPIGEPVPTEEPMAEEPPAEETPAEEEEATDPAEWPPVPEEYAVLPDLKAEIEQPEAQEEDPAEQEVEEDEEMLPIDEPDEPEEPEEPAEPETIDDLEDYGWHTIEEGETLISVAARYGLSADTLQTLNEPVPTFLAEGDSLRLPPTFSGYFHEVQPGETITDVARNYGVSIRGLQHVNEMETREIEPGQQLLIPGRPAPEPEPRGTMPEASFEGEAEVFPEAFEGRLLAGGVEYNPSDLVVSHRDLPLGTVVLLTNPETGAHTFAEVTDRGPPDEELIMDLSRAVADALELENGRAHIEVRIVEQDD